MAGNKNMIGAERNAVMIAKQKINAEKQRGILYDIEQHEQAHFFPVNAEINVVIKMIKVLAQKDAIDNSEGNSMEAEISHMAQRTRGISVSDTKRLVDSYNANCIDPKMRLDLRAFPLLINPNVGLTLEKLATNLNKYLREAYAGGTVTPYMVKLTAERKVLAKECIELLEGLLAQIKSFDLQISNRVKYYVKT